MITLVTGGSGSGKSAYAEGLVVSEAQGGRVYIATMHPYDEESYKRIARHRKMRSGKGFETVECYTNLKCLTVSADVALLECMSNLAANEMFEENGAGENTVEEILEGIVRLERQVRHLYIVTNEIFSDGLQYDRETVRYQRYLAEINREIAKRASRVVEVVCGIPVERKAL